MAINEMPVRREDLKLTARIVRYFQAMARLLALVAAMVLAFGVHAHHAGSGTTDSHHTAGPPVSVDHNHYGVACVKTDLDRPGPAISQNAPLSHADCTQVFDPLLRSPAAGSPDYIISIVTAPRELSFRQVPSAFDPPPPRQG